MTTRIPNLGFDLSPPLFCVVFSNELLELGYHLLHVHLLPLELELPALAFCHTCLVLLVHKLKGIVHFSHLLPLLEQEGGLRGLDTEKH